MTKDQTTPLSDPYANVDDEQKWRICADVDLKDHLLIKAVCPFRGIIQTVVNLLFKAVVDECRTRNIIYYSDQNYAELANIVRRRAAPWTPQNGLGQHDPGTTCSIRPTPAHVEDIKPNVPKRTGKAQSTKGRGSKTS